MSSEPVSFSHATFVSPLTWRYGSPAMRAVWSEIHKRRLLRRFWVALASGQQACGLVSQAQLDDLKVNQDRVDLRRAAEIEKTVKHDLMAEIMAYAEQCPVGGAVIHLGATSNDALDNVDALRMIESLDLLLAGLRRLLEAARGRIVEWAHVPTMAFTHIQPAEPTTVGYRVACYAQDFLRDFRTLQHLRWSVRGKGVKGAVGSAASFRDLLAGTDETPATLEAKVMAQLGLQAFPVATQTMTRKQELDIVAGLGSLASSLHKFALDSRFLQSHMVGEWMEEFSACQVGSSTMPFKRNPVAAENICSLARQISSQHGVAWQNHAHAILERSLDDSANRRLFLPEVFLLADEIVGRATSLLDNLALVPGAGEKTLARFGPFAVVERVMLAATRAGGDRQAMHEILRHHCMAVWDEVQAGQENCLPDRLVHDERILNHLDAAQVRRLMADPGTYVGDTAERAMAMADSIAAAGDEATCASQS